MMSRCTGLHGTIYGLKQKPFAGGGEGNIHDIIGKDNLVAKLYHAKMRTTEREQKIIAMLNNPPSAEYIDQFAWPTDLLYENSQFAGYVMPRLNNVTALNEVYVYDDRKGISWDFYISVAKNLAAVINCVHRIGHVCGDLNPDNISVNNQGVITLVDTDSYQIKDIRSGRIFYCSEVGLPEYMPRELLGGNLSSNPLTTYTQKTDNFTLAVLIFCLLMNGSHPFACAISRKSISASDFMPINNIRRGLFPFMQHQPGLTIPKYAPPIDILTDELKNLFKQAFIDGHVNPQVRPTPDKWYYALDRLNRSLKKCAKDRSHLYYYGLSYCPWCIVEQTMQGMPAGGPAGKPQIKQKNVFATPYSTPSKAQGTLKNKTTSSTTKTVKARRLNWMYVILTIAIFSYIVVFLFDTNDPISFQENVQVDATDNLSGTTGKLQVESSVTFANQSITEITSNSAWAEVSVNTEKGGILYWEFSDSNYSPDELETFNGFNGPVGTLIEHLQHNTSYSIRPVFETEGTSYYGEWISFTTDHEPFVTFTNQCVIGITTNNAWVEVTLKTNKGGTFYWELSNTDYPYDELEISNSYDGPIGTLIEHLQHNTSYSIRPVFETEGTSYYGEWISFTTKFEPASKFDKAF
jgi:serine/threonine protein kinase